jgi:hypothetical protein
VDFSRVVHADVPFYTRRGRHRRLLRRQKEEAIGNEHLLGGHLYVHNWHSTRSAADGVFKLASGFSYCTPHSVAHFRLAAVLTFDLTSTSKVKFLLDLYLPTAAHVAPSIRLSHYLISRVIILRTPPRLFLAQQSHFMSPRPCHSMSPSFRPPPSHHATIHFMLRSCHAHVFISVSSVADAHVPRTPYQPPCRLYITNRKLILPQVSALATLPSYVLPLWVHRYFDSMLPTFQGEKPPGQRHIDVSVPVMNHKVCLSDVINGLVGFPRSRTSPSQPSP